MYHVKKERGRGPSGNNQKKKSTLKELNVGERLTQSGRRQTMLFCVLQILLGRMLV